MFLLNYSFRFFFASFIRSLRSDLSSLSAKRKCMHQVNETTIFFDLSCSTVSTTRALYFLPTFVFVSHLLELDTLLNHICTAFTPSRMKFNSFHFQTRLNLSLEPLRLFVGFYIAVMIKWYARVKRLFDSVEISVALTH